MLRDLRHPGKAAHSAYGWVRKKTWGFAPVQWFLQAQTELWAAADPDPPLPIPIPACCSGTHSSYASQGHPCSFSQLRAVSSHGLSMYFDREVLMPLLLTHTPHRRRHSSSHCTVFIVNTQEKTLPAVFLNNRVLLPLLLPCKYCYCCSQQSPYYCH